MILHEIFRVVSRFPRYISCYIAVNRFPLGQYIGYVNTPEHFIFTITTKNNRLSLFILAQVDFF